MEHSYKFSSFMGNLELEKAPKDISGTITIPDDVVYIGNRAFKDCKFLEQIICNKNLKSIYSEAFEGCDRLKKVVLNDGLDRIGSDAFKGCNSLSEICFPDTVTSLGAGAFADCSISYVYIPPKVSYIGKGTFANSNPIIEVARGNRKFYAENGHLFDKSKNRLLSYHCSTPICDLTTIDSLNEIDEDAISGARIVKKIIIGDNVVRLGRISNCTNLVSVRLPKTLLCFEGLTNCSSLTSVRIPEAVNKINSKALKGCSSLLSVVFPKSINKEESKYMYSCFEGCSSLKTVTLPSGITEICKSFFKDCSSLTDVSIPDGVKTIGDYAFENCTSLYSIQLPYSVDSIGERAFNNCKNLALFHTDNSRIEIALDAFLGCTSINIAAFPKCIFKDTYYHTILQCVMNRFHGGSVVWEHSKTLMLYASYFNSLGINIIGIRGRYDDEKSYKSPYEQSHETIKELISKKQDITKFYEKISLNLSGIGMVLGWNDLRIIDIDGAPYGDGLNGYDYFLGFVEECLFYLGLPNDYPWVVRSGSTRGLHIIIRVSDFNGSADIYSYTGARYPEFRSSDAVELLWRGFGVLPPSIHKSGNKYEFVHHATFPTQPPSYVALDRVTKLLSILCGFDTCNLYSHKGRKFVLVDNVKGSSVSSNGYVCESIGFGKGDLSWLEICKWYDNLAIKYVLGADVQLDFQKAKTYFLKADSKRAFFNLASLISVGMLDGTIKDVRYYLNKLGNTYINIVDSDERHVKIFYDEFGNRLIENHHLYILKHAEEFASKCENEYLLFFDTETTGLPRNYDDVESNYQQWPRLVQLAWILCDEQKNIIRKASYIIKPNGYEIPLEATKIHGITTAEAHNDGSSISSVLQDFMADVSCSSCIVGHNVEYDKSVIISELLRAEIEGGDILKTKRSICTMTASVNYCKIPSVRGYKYPKLQELYLKLFGRSFEDAHKADSDIEATFKCYWELKRMKIISENS